MKRKIVQIITIIFMVFTIVNVFNVAYADDINTDDFKNIYDKNGVSDLDSKGGKILSIVQIGGSAVAISALIVIGIRFMIASPDEKATLKEQLVPYVIGILIFFMATNIVSMGAKFAFQIK